MEDFEIVKGEQPDEKEGLKADRLEKIDKENKLGSLLGKFKDANALLDAYNNLQSEFTKKCQKLSEIQKEKENIDSNKKEETASLEQVKNIDSEDTLTEKASIPFYMKNDWQDKVQEFVGTHKYATSILNELTEELLADESLVKREDGLELAYNKILARKFKTGSELLQDDEFMEKYIFNNDNLNMKIIKNYLSKLDKKKAPPVIFSTKGSHTTLASNGKVSSLTEASKLAGLLFDN